MPLNCESVRCHRVRAAAPGAARSVVAAADADETSARSVVGAVAGAMGDLAPTISPTGAAVCKGWLTLTSRPKSGFAPLGKLQRQSGRSRAPNCPPRTQPHRHMAWAMSYGRGRRRRRFGPRQAPLLALQIAQHPPNFAPRLPTRDHVIQAGIHVTRSATRRHDVTEAAVCNTWSLLLGGIERKVLETPKLVGDSRLRTTKNQLKQKKSGFCRPYTQQDDGPRRARPRRP